MKLVLELEPLPQPRVRFNRRTGIAYDTAAEYKRAVAYLAKAAMQGRPPISEPLSVRFFRKYKPHSRRFGDTDNLLKSLLDGLNKIVYADDALITSLTAEKVQSERGRIEIEVEKS